VSLEQVLPWITDPGRRLRHGTHPRQSERVGRLLDPKDRNVTLATLQRAAEIAGRKVRLELV
jgi:hypothetical protein